MMESTPNNAHQFLIEAHSTWSPPTSCSTAYKISYHGFFEKEKEGGQTQAQDQEETVRMYTAASSKKE